MKWFESPEDENIENAESPQAQEIISNAEIRSYASVTFEFGYDGRELKPGQNLIFSIPKEFHNRVVRDVVLRHRKPEQYRKDIGADRYDPHGAYSRVELHDTKQNKWVGWSDPKGYSADKFAEPRQASDPENEVLHDWVATVGEIRTDLARVTNVGASQKYSVSSIHGLELVFFPDAKAVKYQEKVYCAGTEFVDLEKGKKLPKYGGGSHTEGKYPRAIALNHHGDALYELSKDPGPNASLESGDLLINLESGKKLLQVEVAIGDTEHLKEISSKTKRHTRLGYAKLSVGILRSSGETNWFVTRANVPPQGVISGSPFLEKSKINAGDKLIIQSEDDASYVMGWRIAYDK